MKIDTSSNCAFRHSMQRINDTAADDVNSSKNNKSSRTIIMGTNHNVVHKTFVLTYSKFQFMP
jgi:hypothetical protein